MTDLTKKIQEYNSALESGDYNTICDNNVPPLGNCFIIFVKGARKGSVARAFSSEEKSNYSYNQNYIKIVYKIKNKEYKETIHKNYYYNNKIKILKSIYNEVASEKYVFTRNIGKPKPVIKPITDLFDQNIEVGDMLFTENKFVNVTAIRPNNKFRAIPIKLTDKDRIYRIHDKLYSNHKDAIKITKNLYDELIMRKLQYG